MSSNLQLSIRWNASPQLFRYYQIILIHISLTIELYSCNDLVFFALLFLSVCLKFTFFSVEILVFSLLLLFELLSVLLSSIDMALTLLASRLFSEKKSKLFGIVIRLDDGGLIYDEVFLGRMKGLVLLSSSRIRRILNIYFFSSNV